LLYVVVTCNFVTLLWPFMTMPMGVTTPLSIINRIHLRTPTTAATPTDADPVVPRPQFETGHGLSWEEREI